MRRLLNNNIKQNKSNRSYIFSGIIICDECGYHMSGTHNRDYHYYRCSKCYNDLLCHNRGLLNEKIIENFLLENSERLIEEHINKVGKTEENIKPIKSNKKAIEKKLEKLNQLFINEFIDMDKYKKEYALLQSQIIDDSETQKKDLSHLKEFIQSDFKSFYQTLTVMEKQAMWRSVIKEVRVRHKEIVDVIFV